MKKPYLGGLVHPAFWPGIETHFPIGSIVQDESGGQIVPCAEPVCEDCGKRVLQQIVDSAPNGVAESAQAYVNKMLGSETPS